MDWPNDNACLGNSSVDLKRIFKYKSRPCRVIRIVSQNDYKPQVWSLETPEEWTNWLLEYTKQPGQGLIVVLANRIEDNSYCEIKSGASSIEDFVAIQASASSCTFGLRRETTFAPLGEKQPSLDSIGRESSSLPPPSSTRSLRHLPFEKDTFAEICERFQIHKSIVRTLTRSDVPTFSCDEVEMKGRALGINDTPAQRWDLTEKVEVYNCRTSNSWDLDIALAATHYPQQGLTFAILFGSSQATENTILERLRYVTMEAAHPILLPGIFAELELARHIRLVEASINDVETRIFELNFQSNKVRDNSRSEIEKRSEAKRTAWLDLSYLRNSLITWNTQLLRMAEHAEVLNLRGYTAASPSDGSSEHTTMQTRTSSIDSRMTIVAEDPSLPAIPSRPLNTHGSRSWSPTSESHDINDDVQDTKQVIATLHDEKTKAQLKKMHTTGRRIIVRLAAIRDEYDEKIRDCTMRVDGMAMATQWSQNETAVEIAVATNQDSKVMRSISLVTMVFLPGTFFATVFSMTFFNWSGDSGEARVSKYLWIYVVVTLLFTAITIGLWYFFVIFRRKGPAKSDEEKLRVE